MRAVVVSLMLASTTSCAAEAPPIAEIQPTNNMPIEFLFYERLTKCWSGIDDLPDANKLQVTLKVQLAEDGTLASEPIVIKPEGITYDVNDMEIAVERSLRSVRDCEPFQLPPEGYEIWRTVTITLGTRDD